MKPTIQKILVPTDYSANAKRSGQLAAMLAKSIGAELIMYHTYHLPVVGVAESIVIVEREQNDQLEKMQEYVEELKIEYGEIKVSGLVDFGSATDCISNFVSKNKIDLIIMGTKGETDSSNVLFGSVATHVMNNVKCPVLIIPKGSRAYNISEVLFATDYHYTNDTLKFLSPFMALMQEYEPFIHIVSIKPDQVEQNHSRNVEETKLKEIMKNFKTSYHYIESPDTENELFHFAEKNHCDLIVMVTKHYSLWERIFHRSLTKQIAMHSEIPILVLHEDSVN